MRILFKIVFMSMFAVGLITTLDSCRKVEGCTDPEAENYNADAEVSDGNCVYPREKFLGTFVGELACQAPLPNDEEFIITITEGLSNNSEVLINFQEVENAPLPELAGRVEGNTLIIDPERVSLPLDPENNPDLLTDLEFSGEATISGDNLSGQLAIQIVLLGSTLFCDITGVRQ